MEFIVSWTQVLCGQCKRGLINTDRDTGFPRSVQKRTQECVPVHVHLDTETLSADIAVADT